MSRTDASPEAGMPATAKSVVEESSGASSAAPDESAARTGWYHGTVRPAREGVYERRSPAGPFACWNGRGWNADAPDAATAAAQEIPSTIGGAPWRGLAAASGAPCATCRGHTVVDLGVDADSGRDLIDECPDC